MFSEQLKNHIKDNTKGYFDRQVERAIDAFDKSLCLDSPREDIEGVADLIDLLEARASEVDWTEIKTKTGHLVIKFESYLKFLLGNVNPDRFSTGPESGNKEWMLETLMKEGLTLIPESINLSSGRPIEKKFPFRDQYLHIYRIRNMEAHCYNDYSHEEIFSITRDVLIAYLYAAFRNSKEIDSLYQKKILAQSFHAREYCKKIKEWYEKCLKSGFYYVDIKWRSEKNNVQVSSIEKLRMDANSRLIKIVGEAGSGKTTALKRLEYLEAKHYLKSGHGPVPVYIPLIELENDPTALPQIIPMVAKILNVSEENAEKMISHGECTLLLDGYNEILGNRLKRQFAKSLDDLAAQYEDITIILTDRALMKNAVKVMNSADKYCLYPLDREMKTEFIVTTCEDKTAKEILLSKMSSNPEYFDHFLTPMQLSHLIQLISRTKKITIDPEGDYLEFLLEREAEEKKILILII